MQRIIQNHGQRYLFLSKSHSNQHVIDSLIDILIYRLYRLILIDVLFHLLCLHFELQDLLTLYKYIYKPQVRFWTMRNKIIN